jgi:hypothetical protein
MEIGRELAAAQILVNQPTTESPAPTDGEILARMGTDAAKWTEEFLLRQAQRAGQPGPSNADEWGTMVGWFANAIEAGRAAGRVETCPHEDLFHAAGMVICRACGTTPESPLLAT